MPCSNCNKHLGLLGKKVCATCGARLCKKCAMEHHCTKANGLNTTVLDASSLHLRRSSNALPRSFSNSTTGSTMSHGHPTTGPPSTVGGSSSLNTPISPQCTGAPYPVGTRVVVDGLTSTLGKPLNGCCGAIESYDASAGRHVIIIDGRPNAPVRVLTENIRRDVLGSLTRDRHQPAGAAAKPVPDVSVTDLTLSPTANGGGAGAPGPAAPELDAAGAPSDGGEDSQPKSPVASPLTPTGPPCQGPRFGVGTLVVIRGLTSTLGRPLNGKTAIVESWDSSAGRHVVQVNAKPERPSVRVLPENIDVLPT